MDRVGVCFVNMLVGDCVLGADAEKRGRLGSSAAKYDWSLSFNSSAIAIGSEKLAQDILCGRHNDEADLKITDKARR